MSANNGKYFFIPDWLLQENSQTIHAYIYILNEINSNGGECKTSYRIIAKELHLSLQNIRTIVKALTQQPTHRVTQQSTHGKTLLSIDFIGVLEDFKKPNNTVANTEPTQLPTQKQPTNSFDFRKSLIEYGFKSNLVDDWLKVRKTKKATNTETSFNKFINELKKTNISPDEILEICISKDWKGFEAKWLTNLQNQNLQNGQQITNPTKTPYKFSVARVIETHSGKTE